MAVCWLQAQLKAGTVEALRKAVPGLTDDHISLMQRCPMRSWDPQLIQEPHVYRLYEVHGCTIVAECAEASSLLLPVYVYLN